MSKLQVSKTETWFSNEKDQPIAPETILELQDFHQHLQTVIGEIPPFPKMNNLGDLAIFYGENQEIAGFIYCHREIIRVMDRNYTLSWLEYVLNPIYSCARLAARFFLTASLKYKLNHPEEELIHLGKAFNPIAYDFFVKLTTNLYPKPNQTIPPSILSLFNQIKEQEHWQSSPNHPMVIKTHEKPMLHYLPQPIDENLQQFYKSINPGFETGDCLMVCVPLSILAITYGIRQILAMENQTQPTPAPLTD